MSRRRTARYPCRLLGVVGGDPYSLGQDAAVLLSTVRNEEAARELGFLPPLRLVGNPMGAVLDAPAVVSKCWCPARKKGFFGGVARPGETCADPSCERTNCRRASPWGKRVTPARPAR